MLNLKFYSKKLAVALMTFLSAVLFVNANTVSSTVIYQPEAPKELNRFSIIK